MVIICLRAAIERRASKGASLKLFKPNKPGLLAKVKRTFRENAMNVTKAEIFIRTGHLRVKELSVMYHQKAKNYDQQKSNLGEIGVYTCYSLSSTALALPNDGKDESDEILSRGFKDIIYDVYRYLPPELELQDESNKILSRGFKNQIYDVYRYLPLELQSYNNARSNDEMIAAINRFASQVQTAQQLNFVAAGHNQDAPLPAHGYNP
nr:ACT domain-containing protein ACR8-like [Tanacetum cinerariifolium]